MQDKIKKFYFFNIIVWNNNLIISPIKMHIFCLFQKKLIKELGTQ